VLPTLCLTQVVGWGTVYYSFPVLSGVIGAETGWSATGMAGAFTGALVASALVGVPLGRRLDRHGPRGLMSAGSLLAALAMGLVGWSPTLGWFVAAWLLAGVAMSATLYPPAFVAVTRWYGERRVQALTVLTLAGGLASTVFAPVTALLADRMGWRAAYLVLAGVIALVAAPAHWWGLRAAWPPAPPPAHAGHLPDRVLKSRAFLALALAMSLAACASYAVVVNLVPLLTDRGMGVTVAAAVLGIGGAAQVVGRLGYPVLARALPVRARTVAVLAGVAVTTAVLGLATSTPALVLAVVVAGALRGLLTLLHATAVTDRWGTSHYGRLTGLLSAPVALSAALAPWLSAALATVAGGHPPMFLALAAVAVAAALVGLGSLPERTHPAV
jgi:MFS family permease